MLLSRSTAWGAPWCRCDVGDALRPAGPTDTNHEHTGEILNFEARISDNRDMTRDAEGGFATVRKAPVAGFGSRSPIEVLDAALDSPDARDIEESMGQSAWRGFRSDLTAFGFWLGGRDWTDPAQLGGYLRDLESTGASFSTIERRTTSVAKLVEVLVANGQMAPDADPASHPTTQIAIKAIRRRLGTDVGEARSLSAEGLIEVLLAIDDTTLIGRRDISMLVVGWFGTLRVHQLAGLRRGAVSITDSHLDLTLRDRRSPANDGAVVPIRRTPGSRWCPASTLESWLTTLHELAPDSDVVWPRITGDDELVAGTPPLEHAEVDTVIAERVAATGSTSSESTSNVSTHSLRSGWISEANDRQVDEADTMRNSRLRSLSIGNG